MSVLNQLKDYRVVKVSLPQLAGSKLSLDAVAKTTTSPQFEVTFLPDQLHPELLDPEEFCLVTFDVAGETKSIKAKVVSAEEEAKLLLEMVESFAYIQKRGYFRVDADLSVSYWTIDDEHPSAKSVQTPVNISGGGLRLPVSEEIKAGTRLGLEIVIDSPQPAVVECVGEVVANYDDKGGRQLALTFVDIEDEDQDAIIAYCLAEQRKQLRLKVKLLGGTVS
ncbi:PilZ domain-containing protein [uncultured Desulfuromusa sp.]|uniref:flagellar brake protein n=1 Tax=uncultured Desulfuromusa sp. TaxID=219183 RepID=UPI002AA5F35C|nr:PilZ domain-containing protein [uncultured Desulfuromusa sp.]